MVVSKRWFEFSGGTKFRYPLLPQFNLLFASILPLFNLFFTSFEPQFNLCFIANLEPRFGNHGLQTLGLSLFCTKRVTRTLGNAYPGHLFEASIEK